MNVYDWGLFLSAAFIALPFLLMGTILLSTINLASSSKKLKSLLIAELAETKCPSCSEVFGPEAAEAAPENYRIQCKQFESQRDELFGGDLLSQSVPEWPVNCADCGHTSFFNFDDKQIFPTTFDERCRKRGVMRAME